MSATAEPGSGTPPDAMLAARLFAVDPCGLGGIAVRARAGPQRDRWIAAVRRLLPPDTPFRRLPLHADDARIFGGLDLPATLAAGQPVAERGLLADADGGVVVLSMAERLSPALAARLGEVLERGSVTLERDGLTRRHPAAIGLLALDEGLDDDEGLAPALLDRLAFLLDGDGMEAGATDDVDAGALAPARRLYPTVRAGEDILSALCETALALGVWSMRASLLALRVARAAAALDGRPVVTEHDAAVAARFVLAPRATRLPAAPDPEPAAADETAPSEDRTDNARPDDGETDAASTARQPPGDVVLSAAKAAIPPGLLDRLRTEAIAPPARAAAGRAGALRPATRGRPAGLRTGKPAAGARLNVIATLRAAAPWQRIRGRAADAVPGRIAIRRDDLRVTRFKQRGETTTIFVVDASGSLAANRLAEAKGAVELLLAECYVRRDSVALLAFRGKTTELLLPPTRSLARAKRSLAELPGGGSTPLAGAIDAAVDLAAALRRRGQTPVVVFLTDGRGNVARDGTTGRSRAEEDVRLAARIAGAAGVRMIVVDASPRPQPPGQELAKALGARYVALPRAEASALSRAVLAASAP